MKVSINRIESSNATTRTPFFKNAITGSHLSGKRGKKRPFFDSGAIHPAAGFHERTETESIQRVGNPVTEADLPSPAARGISGREQTIRRFMREVYRRQVAIWLGQGATYRHEIPDSELVTLPSSYSIPNRTVQVHRDIQHPTINLINDARASLRRARAPGVTNVGIRSGYRSAPRQFIIWRRWAPQYYRDTRAERRDRTRFPQGEHSDAAAQYLAEYTNERVFSPGYSPHQHGRTIDVSYEQNGAWAPADTSTEGIRRWEQSWLYRWLRRNAFRYGFFPNPDINEPWHWEFSPLVATLLQIVQWFLDLLEPLFGRIDLWLGGERSPEESPEQPDQEPEPSQEPEAGSLRER